MLLEHLEMARYLFAISLYPRILVNGILNELIATTKGAIEHKLLTTHWWPSDEGCGCSVSPCVQNLNASRVYEASLTSPKGEL